MTNSATHEQKKNRIFASNDFFQTEKYNFDEGKNLYTRQVGPKYKNNNHYMDTLFLLVKKFGGNIQNEQFEIIRHQDNKNLNTYSLEHTKVFITATEEVFKKIKEEKLQKFKNNDQEDEIQR